MLLSILFMLLLGASGGQNLLVHLSFQPKECTAFVVFLLKDFVEASNIKASIVVQMQCFFHIPISQIANFG